jgi:soluble lytic murein transglycosylase-like protein
MYGGDVRMALMAYNGGPGTMSRRGVTSASDLYKMPQETQNYVVKVMSNYQNMA